MSKETKDYQMYIAGAWTESESGACLEATSPATGESIGGRYSMETFTELKTVILNLE